MIGFEKRALSLSSSDFLFLLELEPLALQLPFSFHLGTWGVVMLEKATTNKQTNKQTKTNPSEHTLIGEIDVD